MGLATGNWELGFGARKCIRHFRGVPMRLTFRGKGLRFVFQIARTVVPEHGLGRVLPAKGTTITAARSCKVMQVLHGFTEIVASNCLRLALGIRLLQGLLWFSKVLWRASCSL